jgi:hypothetical protein
MARLNVSECMDSVRGNFVKENSTFLNESSHAWVYGHSQICGTINWQGSLGSEKYCYLYALECRTTHAH